MKFQRKIMLLYLIFSVFTAVLLGGGYYSIRMRQNIQDEYQNLNILADQYEQQWNEYVKSMDSIISYILSDPEILEALYTLARTDSDDAEAMLRKKDASEIVSQRIVSDYINDNFYRVVLFNTIGDIAASNNYGETTVQSNLDIRSLSWLSKIENTKGKNILVGKHTDD